MFSVLSYDNRKMEVNEKNDISHMYYLPDELISSILSYSDIRDITNFSSSCKRFNELLNNSNCLWKQKYGELIPTEFQRIVIQNKNEVDWLHELKEYCLLKKLLISELVQMSPQFYWKEAEASLEDIKPFFKLATLTYINYYYTVYILQEIIRETKKLIDKNTCLKPVNTLTITYYAKKVLRHLIQTYLCIKWARHACHDELIPQVVVNYFIQWIDPDNIHSDEDVEEKIQYLADLVKDTLKESTKGSGNKASKPHSERDILLAISETIYKRLKVKVTSLDVGAQTLDIVKVINDKNGSVIAFGTIYQAVARVLGVHCELNSFSNHFFLEWQCNEGSVKRMYTIDLSNGDLRPKRQCPYSRRISDATGGEKYHPGSFIQFIYAAYMQSKGAVQDWEYQNASHLYDFLSSHDTDNIHNPYKDFFVFLGRYAAAPALGTRINIKCMEEEHRNLIMMLSDLNTPQESIEIVLVKKRTSELKYAVGMVCYHVQYYYMCVVCDWETGEVYRPTVYDPHCAAQPTYTVITEDQCVRYVPQEKIKPLSQPRRIKTIEDLLGRDFTHFDGHAYVSNDEKVKEYPDDRCIVEEYINRLFIKSK